MEALINIQTQVPLYQEYLYLHAAYRAIGLRHNNKPLCGKTTPNKRRPLT